MLRFRSVVNGRLVMVRTKQKAYYEYWIFPTDKEDYYKRNSAGNVCGDNDLIIKSGFVYEKGVAAFSAGKKKAKELQKSQTHD